MKQYRLKEEVKELIHVPDPDVTNTLKYWKSVHVKEAALKEVIGGVEFIKKENGENFTAQECVDIKEFLDTFGSMGELKGVLRKYITGFNVRISSSKDIKQFNFFNG